MTLAPGTKLGPYEILAPIGAGGMGEVYRAHDSRVGRDVAIKISSEQFTDRFTREVHAVAALNHSNVCTLYDVGPNYLVMELVEGPTLADRIRQGPIPLEESLEIARQIADALEAAHEKGIVHRDLKPGNIKIRPDGMVKVLDFGLAKVEETAAVGLETSPTLSVAQTAAGVLLGTAAYMSPEQARGKPVDKRADIWAFGVVLYEMLTGNQLFSGETVSDTLAAVLKEEPDWEKVPAKAQPLLRRCLERDPKKRLRDIGDANALLESVSEAAAVPESVKPPAFWLGWALAAVLLIALSSLAFVHFRKTSSVVPNQVRFQIGLPDKTNLAPWGSFALSPDGRHLAFAAVGPDAVTRLYIRELDSIEIRPLDGTESGYIPPFFWSPDSRSIAFNSGTKLKKIDISGGAALPITNLVAFGGSWNRAGVIIFGTLGGGIMRVSAAGGTASPVTALNPKYQETLHMCPTFLPDGRHFLYFCDAGPRERDGLYLGSVDKNPGEQGYKQIISRASWAHYLPSRDSGPGSLIFMQRGQNTLVAQKFDDKRLELVGEPVILADQIGTYSNYADFSAARNGTLVYRTGPETANAQLMWFDRQGKPLGTAGGRLHAGLALSPDGVQAAIALVDFSKSAPALDVWLLDLVRGIPKRFTFGKGDNYLPIWSADGSRIIFASNREGGIANLYQKLANGAKEEELLLRTGESKIPRSWSSDGRYLLYVSLDSKNRGDLWVLPLEGDRKPVPFLQTEFNEIDGSFSPDMRWIAYQSDESGRNEIWVREFLQPSGGKSSQTAGRWQVSNGGGTNPKWRRDSKELYYRTTEGGVMVVDITGEAAFQAGAPKPLFQVPPFMSAMVSLPIIGAATTWDVTRDGRQFLLTTHPVESSPSPFTVVLNWTSLLSK